VSIIQDEWSVGIEQFMNLHLSLLYDYMIDILGPIRRPYEMCRGRILSSLNLSRNKKIYSVYYSIYPRCSNEITEQTVFFPIDHLLVFNAFPPNVP